MVLAAEVLRCGDDCEGEEGLLSAASERLFTLMLTALDLVCSLPEVKVTDGMVKVPSFWAINV